METTDGLPTPRRYWAVLAISMALCMSVLDTSIANVALPTIAHEMKAAEADAIWVVNAYQIVVTVSVFPLASLGDRVGHRRMYQIGLAVFILASLACALADSILTLSLARAVQGLGAAILTSMNGALIRFTYPSNRLGQAVGVSAMVVGVSLALGPTIASGILAVGSWRWLFGVNVPFGLVTMIVAGLALPATQRSPHRFDLASAVLSAAMFGLVIYGLEGLARDPTAWTWAQIVAGLAAGYVVVRRSLNRPAPMIPLDLLRAPSFALAATTSVCAFVAWGMAMVGLPFLMTANLGRTAVETGLLMTPWPMAAAAFAPISGRLADRLPAGLLGGVGLTIFATALVLLATIPPGASDVDIAWRMALCGAGFSMFQAPNNRVMMGAAPLTRAGAAGGTVSTARLVGQTMGALGLAVLFRLAPDEATRAGLGLAAGVAVAAAVVSSLRLRRPQT